jgi:hypothetical protein
MQKHDFFFHFASERTNILSENTITEHHQPSASTIDMYSRKFDSQPMFTSGPIKN